MSIATRPSSIVDRGRYRSRLSAIEAMHLRVSEWSPRPAQLPTGGNSAKAVPCLGKAEWLPVVLKRPFVQRSLDGSRAARGLKRVERAFHETRLLQHMGVDHRGLQIGVT
jgi:hypothetical protein